MGSAANIAGETGRWRDGAIRASVRRCNELLRYVI
jgi:hypothetical protein